MITKRANREIKIFEKMDKKGLLSKKGKKEFEKKARSIMKRKIKNETSTDKKAELKKIFEKYFKVKL